MNHRWIFITKVLCVVILPTRAAISDYTPANQQYHIQTDEGPDRYFKYQTMSGQYRKERRLEDGTVVGTYAWIDDNGFLRQNDYVADNAGYRVRKAKQVYVGKHVPINDAMKLARRVYSAADSSPDFKLIHNGLVEGPTKKAPSGVYNQIPQVVKNSEIILEKSPYVSYSTPRPFYNNDVAASQQKPVYSNSYPSSYRNRYNEDSYNNLPYSNDYGNVVTQNGFRYYIPRAYHEEAQNLPYQEKTGSFGYVDPFGIRRVIYYNTAPGTGFQHKKHNTYVGLNAAPFDSVSY